jgi:hypothetical protein
LLVQRERPTPRLGDARFVHETRSALRVPEMTAAAPELHGQEKPRLVTVDEREPETVAERCSRPGTYMRAGTLIPSSPRPRSSVATVRAHNASREDRCSAVAAFKTGEAS